MCTHSQITEYPLPDILIVVLAILNSNPIFTSEIQLSSSGCLQYECRNNFTIPYAPTLTLISTITLIPNPNS